MERVFLVVVVEQLVAVMVVRFEVEVVMVVRRLDVVVVGFEELRHESQQVSVPLHDKIVVKCLIRRGAFNITLRSWV